jgi:nicotinamidase-related amidase
MQNDYCSECNSPTVSKWALTGLPNVAHHINLLHNSNSNNDQVTIAQVTIAQVVFTQDWLPDSSTFLRRNTYGAEIIHALEQPEGSLTFTKSSDDWMNRLGPTEKCTYCDPSYDNNYHFSLNNEKGSTTTNPNGGRPTLDQYLTSAGYPPAETRLIVTGIAENRCVMKGSIHALDLGYKDVVLYFPGKSF